MSQRVVGVVEPEYDPMRVYFDSSPFGAKWVAHPEAPVGTAFSGVFACRYSLAFEVPGDCVVRVRVSGDERYVVALDGVMLGRGPERGSVSGWHFETYDLVLKAGRHRLSAMVFSLGKVRPWAQESVRHAFVLLGEGEMGKLVSTGVAPWVAARVDAYEAMEEKLSGAPLVTGARFRMRGDRLRALAQEVAVAEVGPFVLASMRMESPSQWKLVAATLPAMWEKAVSGGKVRQVEGELDTAAFERMLRGEGTVVVPAGKGVKVLIDLEDYYCVYWRLVVSGGAGGRVRVAFAESLYEGDGKEGNKGNRDAVEGKRFVGAGDECLCSGGETVFEPLWWMAGRYVEVSVRTEAEAVEIKALEMTETRYPVTWDSAVETGDSTIESFLPITRRAMEMCAHETFVDCPFYEQLMYAGDTRLEALVTYTHSKDDRLARKAVRLFDGSRGVDGWTRSRTPAWKEQTIPPFSLWWVGMVHDLAMWRDVPGEVRERMGGVRAVMEAAYAQVGGDGMYLQPSGWNFVDWVPGWDAGLSPNVSRGSVGVLHFQLAYIAGLAADLEEMAGEALLARRHRERKEKLVAAGRQAFWDAKLGLFSDDREHQHHSEHTQCMAYLTGAVGEGNVARFGEALVKPNNLARATIYFSHYLFETFRGLGRVDAMLERWKLWGGLKAGGFKTTPESPEPARSDCHAWGAHPMYHLYASVLGVRPASAGFRTVEIWPQLGRLTEVKGKLLHPRGEIRVEARKKGERVEVEVVLPAGVKGKVRANGEVREVG